MGGAMGAYVTVADGGGLNGAYTATISMWVKWSGTQNPAFGWCHYGAVLGRNSVGPIYSNNIFSLSGSDPNSATLAWSASEVGTQITGTTAIGDGVWHHLAVTYQPHFLGECELFLDGVSQGTASTDAFTLDPESPTNPLYIGGWGDRNGSYVTATASIDDVAIFDDLLSPTQIAELAAQTKTPLTVGDGTMPAGGVPIRGVVATASSEFVASSIKRYANNSADGVGRLTTNASGEVGNASGMWETVDGGVTWVNPNLPPDPDPEITYDLGEERTLSKMVVYNYNEYAAGVPDLTKQGIQEAEILVAGEDQVFTSLGIRTFTEAPGDETNPGQVVSLSGVTARYVKFNVLSTFYTTFPTTFPAGVNTYVGLNEVDFYEGTAVAIPGDTNGDMIVDADDAAKLAANWGKTDVTGASNGDFNGDRAVNAADASILAANWGDHRGTESAGAVPEPSVLTLMAALAAFAVWRRRHAV